MSYTIDFSVIVLLVSRSVSEKALQQTVPKAQSGPDVELADGRGDVKDTLNPLLT